jgi:hypothetical protein
MRGPGPPTTGLPSAAGVGPAMVTSVSPRVEDDDILAGGLGEKPGRESSDGVATSFAGAWRSSKIACLPVSREPRVITHTSVSATIIMPREAIWATEWSRRRRTTGCRVPRCCRRHSRNRSSRSRSSILGCCLRSTSHLPNVQVMATARIVHEPSFVESTTPRFRLGMHGSLGLDSRPSASWTNPRSSSQEEAEQAEE